APWLVHAPGTTLVPDSCGWMLRNLAPCSARRARSASDMLRLRRKHRTLSCFVAPKPVALSYLNASAFYMDCICFLVLTRHESPAKCKQSLSFRKGVPMKKFVASLLVAPFLLLGTSAAQTSGPAKSAAPKTVSVTAKVS